MESTSAQIADARKEAIRAAIGKLEEAALALGELPASCLCANDPHLSESITADSYTRIRAICVRLNDRFAYVFGG